MTAITAYLTRLLEDQHDAIGEWFKAAYQSITPVLYSSVDLRHSGSKLAPVDTNLFPAGFNNLNAPGMERAIRAFRGFFEKWYPGISHIALVMENHTRNLNYLDNVAVLKELLEKAGKKVTVTVTDPLLVGEPLTSASGKKLAPKTMHSKEGTLHIEGEDTPDIVVLNNDLSTGVPAVLQHISQPIVPSVRLGWYVRRKSEHFTWYDHVVRNFSGVFNIDPFLISTVFHHCGMVNFKDRTGIECVALGVEKVLRTVREKYKEHGIADEPYVFIKADNGTYGMGIMTARSGDELYEMNKKLRNKMDVIKGGVVNTEVIIQEGIQTIDRIDGYVAEPMLYLVGGEPVSCIYRVNTEHDAYGNLNAHGMHFEKNICNEDSADSDPDTPCRFSVFGLIAKLASLAAAKERYEI